MHTSAPDDRLYSLMENTLMFSQFSLSFPSGQYPWAISCPYRMYQLIFLFYCFADDT